MSTINSQGGILARGAALALRSSLTLLLLAYARLQKYVTCDSMQARGSPAYLYGGYGWSMIAIEAHRRMRKEMKLSSFLRSRGPVDVLVRVLRLTRVPTNRQTQNWLVEPSCDFIPF